MALQVLTGRASNVGFGSDLTYAATSQGAVPIKNQLVSMRLDNAPVLFRSRTLPSISDGDQIAAAGKLKNGTLDALAIRNLTTGAAYHPPTVMFMILAAILIVLGIALLWIFIGFFFLPIGAWALYRGLKVRKAVALLADVQPAPAAAKP